MSRFVQRQMLYTRWIGIDGINGTVYVPFDDVYPTQNKKTFTPTKTDVADFYDGEIYTIEIRDGFGVRLCWPGFMDYAAWTVFESKDQANAWLDELEEE